jgi:hypothetical protein
LCNIYALILWSVRLGSSRQQFNFIYSRLARSARPEIPRFRFDFKHATRDVGYYVQETLVKAFLNEYLEADGYFFIRLLAANASDFIVQEVIEKLWAIYILKYGENDAKIAEDAFFAFRKTPSFSQLFSQNPSRTLSTADTGLTDSERKYVKQHSEMGVGLLATTTTNLFAPISEQNEQV